ncbi:hypothetical protein EIY89_20550 [Shewanella algae]|nr:hypothetical protein EIY89_20550 [Shewanella algae]
MKPGYILLFLLLVVLASTQTQGLLRALIELSAFAGFCYLFSTLPENIAKRRAADKQPENHSEK